MKTALPALALLALALCGAGGPAHAHSFYSTYCCRGEVDCEPIPETAVKITARGYLVTLRPTEHRMLVNEPGPRTYLIPFSEAKPSPDGRYPACIYPGPDTLRCFYAPPPGS